ncbi:MAG TPA: hypothetical protein VJN89_09735 [Candidatus Acidoferrum sp.]|nr:hypothetical protein [Candidatus Acidoferrum sp.]
MPTTFTCTTDRVLSVARLMPIAVLYFFFNSVGLPTGLFYTTILSPLLFLWLFKRGERWITLKFFVCLSPFVIAHTMIGIDSPFYYARSSLLLWTVCVTVCAFCVALLSCQKLGRLFEQLIVLNFGATVVALVLLFTRFRGVLWNDYSDSFEEGSNQVLRLQLLTSEPSVYALLMIPLLVFAVLRLFREAGKRNLRYAIMILIPFLLSQSLVGLGMSVAGIGVAVLVAFRDMFRKRAAWAALAVMVLLIAGLGYVQNPVSQRIVQVLAGQDSSTDSRTVSSFIVAYNVALPKSLLWGAGLGQAKLTDVSDLGLAFTIGVIPNAVAGTFAELGIIGVLVKFVVLFYLFFRTRVYANSFRLAMFVAVFIAHLTGSYFMNVQEYVMWFLAFGPFFPEMDFRGFARLRVSPA